MPRRKPLSDERAAIVYLHGPKAPEGVDLDALEGFFSALRRALREFDRHARGARPRTKGKPSPDEQRAAAFRLVRFRTGSGVATIEAADLPDDADEPQLPIHGTPLKALVTMDGLLDAIKTKASLASDIVDALDDAQRSLGPTGRFAIKTKNQPRRVTVDEKVIQRLRATFEDSPPRQAGALTIVGRLHSIETDQDKRVVGIRTATGAEWVCSYDDRLRPVVKDLLERIVEARGWGLLTSPERGRIDLSSVAASVDGEGESMFSFDEIPIKTLVERQGVNGPQGLRALRTEELEDDDADALLDAVLDL